MCVNIFIHGYLSIYIYIYVDYCDLNMHACGIYTYIFMYVCMYVCTYVCGYVHVDIIMTYFVYVEHLHIYDTIVVEI